MKGQQVDGLTLFCFLRLMTQLPGNFKLTRYLVCSAKLSKAIFAPQIIKPTRLPRHFSKRGPHNAAVVAAPGGMMDGRGDWAEWEAAARAGDNWNSNCLKLVARWVAIGWSDAQIYERGMALRLDGYSEAETRAEFEYFIHSARSKGSFKSRKLRNTAVGGSPVAW